MPRAVQPAEIASLMRTSEASPPSPPSHLLKFTVEIKEDNFVPILRGLKKEGWRDILSQSPFNGSHTRGESNFVPLIVFPGEELAATCIDPVPSAYSTGLTYGDLLIATAWMRGFSPRLVYFYPNGEKGRQETLLKFVRRAGPLPVIVKQRPSILSIDKTLLLNTIPVNTMDKHGSKLKDLIDNQVVKEKTQFPDFKGKIIIHPDLQEQNVLMNIATCSLAEILDAICYCVDAMWDWIDADVIYIAPRLSSGGAAPYFWPDSR